ncbi:MAG: hypothetical protein KDJ16_13775 [Hyphomicrobiales bacterium]|nr:hypothetical protein [Hyphomicrobiales bacterium]
MKSLPSPIRARKLAALLLFVVAPLFVPVAVQAGTVSCEDGRGTNMPSTLTRHSNGDMTAKINGKKMTRKVLVGGKVSRSALKEICNFMIENGYGFYRISTDPKLFPKRGSTTNESTHVRR